MTDKSPWLYFPNGKRYSLDWLQAHEKVEQDQLQAVFDQEERVHCLCQSRKGDDPSLAPELYVSHRHGKLHLSRMPGTGHEHASWCPFHGQTEADKAPPVQKIHAKFSLELNSANALLASMGIAPKRDEAPASEQHMNLSAVLQRLWRLSGNHRYFAQHKRDWNRVRHFLLKTATHASINDVALAGRLYLPKHYETHQKPERDTAFWDWYDNLTIQPAPGPLGLLLAPIRLDKADMPKLIGGEKKIGEWPQLAFDDLPMRLTLSERAVKQILTERHQTIDWWQKEDSASIKLIGLFLVGRSQITQDGNSKQVLLAYQAALLPVLKNYVPALTDEEAQWMQQLISAKVDYTKVLATEDEGMMPNFWIHSDQGKRLSALISHGESEREKVLSQRKDSLLIWRLDQSEQPPALE